MIEYLGLENFRSHASQSFDLTNQSGIAKIVGFVGKNGAGKTNILEAISMIDGSKGLRGAKVEEVCKKDSGGNFKVVCDIDGERILLEGLKTRKKFALNGNPLKSFQEVAGMVSTIWVSSELEYLFAHSQSTRRDFFDKMTFCFFNNHYALLAKAAKLCSERLNAIMQTADDVKNSPQDLLNSIAFCEDVLSETIIQIMQNRLAMLAAVNTCLDALGTIYLASLKQELKKFEVKAITKQDVRLILEQNRQKDKWTKQTTFNHQKITTQLRVKGKIEGLDEFSAGETKFVLTELCFAFAASLKKINPRRHIVLILDDLFAKLDAKNLDLIIKYIEGWSFGQVFFSSTSAIAHKEDDPRYKIFVL